MKPNIVFLDEYTLGGADLGRLQALGEYKGYARTTPEELPDRCREADVIITNKVVLRRETLRSLPRLRLICVAATGTNNIDLEAAAELGIEVKNAAGYSTHSVAETTLGAAIALRRNIVYYDRYVKSGAYSAAGQQFHFALPTHQLYGSKWGIVGLGAIGREVARLAAAFGCEVCVLVGHGAVLRTRRGVHGDNGGAGEGLALFVGNRTVHARSRHLRGSRGDGENREHQNEKFLHTK